MDEPTFDSLTRLLGRTQSRREALRLLVASGVAAFVAACTGQPLVSPSPSPSPTSAPEDECPIPSVCGARQYCDEEQTCICIKSAEGQVRCGQLPSTCDMPLCQTSADCAHLGEGWFCDTPNSGCCTDPPAELPRCIGPCGAGPVVTATASPYATPAAGSWLATATEHRGMVGQRFDYHCPPGGSGGSIWGTDEYTADSSVCTAAVHAGLISFTSGGDVMIEMRSGRGDYPGSARNGVSSSSWGSYDSSFAFIMGAATPGPSPATVTCPACGTCNDCRLAESNEEVTCGDCSDACVAASLCSSANADVGFGVLAGRLIADGYAQVPAPNVESVRLYGADGLERSVFVTYFALASDPSQTAQLAYRRTFADEVTNFAVLLKDGLPSRALFVQESGAIEEHEVQPRSVEGLLAMAGVETAVLFGCSYNCNILCGALASLGAALLAAALCGPGFTVCALIAFGALAGGLGGAGCNFTCNTICEEAPPIRAYCACPRGLGCYDSAAACTGRCRTGLDCFAQNICGPDPVCNTPLKEFGT